MKDVSVILTTHNAQETVKKAILSVLKTNDQSKIEIIVVDDFSDDDTVAIIENIAEEHDNIKVMKLKENSGSPSKPRNIGIKAANGKYITFLDDDDELDPFNLLKIVNYADMHDLDCVKGYIKVIKNSEIVNRNIIICDNTDSLGVIKNIISKQSTTVDIIVKREFIIKNNIHFDENHKLGEDTLFYVDLFTCRPKIEYYNSFFYYHYKRSDVKNLSSTQSYQDKELNDHLSVWELAENKLNKIGISYYELRLPIAVKNTLNNIIFYSNGKISKQCFNRLSDFLNENIEYLENKITLYERYNAVFNSILEKDYEKFLKLSKKRLLIAGNDLKFIKPALKYLKDDYNIKIDEWTYENTHDEQKSMELLKWADFILCEWIVGNSVWYTRRKLAHQKLLIRAHKYELTRDYGNQVDYTKVDGVITVSYYYLELFTNTFKIPREKMILLSNYVDTNIYTGTKTEDFKNNLAIVGYVPKWKGLLKGIILLKMLKEHNEKFKLYLFGKNYREVDWIWTNPEERSYFEECEKFIKDLHLEDSVIFKGWTERSEMFSNIGYVLSVSDIESFHLAPAEGLCDDTLALLLDWAGVEYVYPNEIIFNDINEMKDMILSTYYDEDKYKKLLKEMSDYAIEEFNVEKFINELKIILQKSALS
ncbi:MAG: glycosyltransferase [Methanobacteriaceae archaeon]|jgi:glycosyltransferase involved in cell wall biosynthesis|nr:glycosyltransferase [Methanobacteriaceae archaeon]